MHLFFHLIKYFLVKPTKIRYRTELHCSFIPASCFERVLGLKSKYQNTLKACTTSKNKQYFTLWPTCLFNDGLIMAIIKSSGNSKLRVWFISRWHSLEASAPAGCSWVCCHPPVPSSASLWLFLPLILKLWIPEAQLTVLPRERGQTVFPPALPFYPSLLWALPWGRSTALCRIPSSSWLKEIRENNWDTNPGHLPIKSRQRVYFSPQFLNCHRLA